MTAGPPSRLDAVLQAGAGEVMAPVATLFALIALTYPIPMIWFQIGWVEANVALNLLGAVVLAGVAVGSRTPWIGATTYVGVTLISAILVATSWTVAPDSYFVFLLPLMPLLASVGLQERGLYALVSLNQLAVVGLALFRLPDPIVGLGLVLTHVCCSVLAVFYLRRDRAEVARVVEAAASAERASARRLAFLKGVSHEMRTPLTSVIGFAELVAEELEGRPEILADLEVICDASQHLRVLVDDVLDLSAVSVTVQQVVWEPVDVERVVQSAVRQVEPLVCAGRNRIVVTGSPVVARADRVRVEQILLNLLSNANKFTHDGTVTVRSSEDADCVYVEVVDTGRGIPEHLVDTVFERFTQTIVDDDRGLGGTGLGLSVSRGLAEAMEGSLTVVSQLGRGSTFRLTLPRWAH